MPEPKQLIRTDNLRTMSDEELTHTMSELKTELLRIRPAFELGVPPTTGLQPNTAMLKNLRKNIARCETIIREREIERGIAACIRKVLKPDSYGLLARQIKCKVKLDIHPSLVAQVCSRMPDVERVNNNDSKARWRLRR